MTAFLTQDVRNAGNRGRPPHPRKRERVHEVLMTPKGAELGELLIEAQKDGSVILTAVSGGRKKSVTFSAPAKAKGRPRKARPSAPESD